MTKFLLHITLLTLLALHQCTPTDNSPIVDIPDQHFLQALLNHNIDSNNDFLISEAEASTIRTLDIGPSGIKSIKGIEAFTNLDSLTIHLNEIDTLDMSSIPGLIYLDCYSCEIEHLNVSQNLSLEELYCSRNKLSVLDVSANTQLKKLSLTVNKITELSLENNLMLTYIRCCGNELTYLDISNNILLNSIGIDNMPMLTKVCVWTLPFPTENMFILMAYSPNVEFTRECL